MAKDKIKLGLAQPLYRNEEAIKMMLYQITPVLTNWAHAQKEAQRQSNPKNAGRKHKRKLNGNPILKMQVASRLILC